MRFREDNSEDLLRSRIRSGLRLVPDELDQIVRLARFKAAHPDVIVGDGGFGTVQARIPKPDGEILVTRYTLRELLDKLGELTAEMARQRAGDPARPCPIC